MYFRLFSNYSYYGRRHADFPCFFPTGMVYCRRTEYETKPKGDFFMKHIGKTALRAYAKLIADKGANVQKGQEVFIAAELDCPDFVTLLVDECYKHGAKKVVVDWSHQPITRLHYRRRTATVLSKFEKYEEARWQHYVDTFPCRIYLHSEDPDGLKGVPTEKLAKSQQKRFAAIKPYRDKLDNQYQWCIAAVPGLAWAKKVFPKLSAPHAVEALWGAILAASRAWEGTDPVENWNKHNKDLSDRCAYLNSLGVESLHYRSSNGTDFTVGMIPQAVFKGGKDETLSGVSFNPNIPSEECFISPMKGKAEGTVVSTKPLSYQGQVIDGFRIRFENGKAVEWHAEKNEELLGKIVTMDEGSAYLGECALVPVDSPISESGLLFYNTLFDENASCHLALGRGFSDTIRGFESMSLEECRALGVNDSMVHVDFMIGAPDLSIDAKTKDGRTVPVFRNGTWAF